MCLKTFHFLSVITSRGKILPVDPSLGCFDLVAKDSKSLDPDSRVETLMFFRCVAENQRRQQKSEKVSNFLKVCCHENDEVDFDKKNCRRRKKSSTQNDVKIFNPISGREVLEFETRVANNTVFFTCPEDAKKIVFWKTPQSILANGSAIFLDKVVCNFVEVYRRKICLVVQLG